LGWGKEGAGFEAADRIYRERRLDEYAEGAVFLGAWPGDQAVANLALNHQNRPLQRMTVPYDLAENRSCRLVWQVSSNNELRSASPRIRSQIELRGIALANLELGVSTELLFQHVDHVAIQLDSQYAATAEQKRVGQRPQAGPKLHDFSPQVGHSIRDPCRDRGLNEEILRETPFGSEAVLPEEIPGIGQIRDRLCHEANLRRSQSFRHTNSTANHVVSRLLWGWKALLYWPSPKSDLG
jgi:hypothetical protein